MFVKNQSNQLVELEIVRFPKSYRRRLRKLVSVSPALADLLVSFPAAAFALVSGYGSVEARGKAVELVKSGAPLKVVAEVLGVPFWSRKLPPEAFLRPLAELPADPEFGRRLGNLVPSDVDDTAVWLDAVNDGLKLCDGQFALWVAGQKKLSLLDHPMRRELLWVLGAFAWFSRNGNASAAELIEKRWSKGMALRSAQASASAWVLDMIRLSQKQPTKRGPGRYSVRNRSSGFAVVVLRSAAELAEEGRVMDHCVGSYAHDVMHGRCLIFGVRWNGQRVATLEVRKGGRREYPHQIVQLQGPGNTKVPPEIRGRINSWFLQHVSNPVAGATSDHELVLMDERKWAEFLAPYREAVSTAFEGECVPAPQYVKNAALLLQQENRW